LKIRCRLSGAGDTLSAALAALVATGTDLEAATKEGLTFLDRSLDAGFRPGMGHVIADRLFGLIPKKTKITTPMNSSLAQTASRLMDTGLATKEQ
jgi:pyridoxal/pyridoxine/pyridoxamine kinase